MDILLNQCGLYLSSQGDRQAALRSKRASLRLVEARLAHDAREISVALGNQSITLSYLGEFAEAEEHINRAVALDEIHRPQSADMAERYLQRANLEFRRAENGMNADLSKAERDILSAREIFKTLGDISGVARASNDFGILRSLQGRSAEEADAYEAALTALRSHPDPNRAEIALHAMNAGAARLEAGQAGAAESLLREAYENLCAIFAMNKGHANLGTSAKWLADCLLTLARTGDAPDARRAEAQAICTRHGLIFAERDAHAAKLARSSDN